MRVRRCRGGAGGGRRGGCQGVEEGGVRAVLAWMSVTISMYLLRIGRAVAPSAMSASAPAARVRTLPILIESAHPMSSSCSDSHRRWARKASAGGLPGGRSTYETRLLRRVLRAGSAAAFLAARHRRGLVERVAPTTQKRAERRRRRGSGLVAAIGPGEHQGAVRAQRPVLQPSLRLEERALRLDGRLDRGDVSALGGYSPKQVPRAWIGGFPLPSGISARLTGLVWSRVDPEHAGGGRLHELVELLPMRLTLCGCAAAAPRHLKGGRSGGQQDHRELVDGCGRAHRGCGRGERICGAFGRICRGARGARGADGCRQGKAANCNSM